MDLDEIGAVSGPGSSGTTRRSPSTDEGEKREGVVGGVAGAAKGVAKKARTLRASAGAAVDDVVLAIVGLLALSSALLGGLVLYRLSRQHLLR
jgi:hypothetical protein